MGRYTNTNTGNGVSRECVEMEATLTTILARVERRCALPPANPEDGHMNRIMAKGLRDALNLTHAFMDAAAANASPHYRVRKLVALADGMPGFIEMVHGLEGEKNLSPLFERVLDREYYEIRKIVGQMRDTVHVDGDKLLEILPKEPPPLGPVGFLANCMIMPFALGLGVMSGIAQGFRGERRDRNNPATPVPEPSPENPPKPGPHLTLVHSR